jgi:hypothetical protein
MEADVNRTVCTSLAAVIAAAGTLAAGQGRNADEILAGARAALGGDNLAAVRTLTAVGHTLRANPNGTSTESEFELSLALPDRYLMRSVMMAMGNMSVYRNSGFNGSQVIEEIDRPPNLTGGNIVIRVAGPGGLAIDPTKMTDEQKTEINQRRLLAGRREFARLALGIFAASTAAYPLTFSDGGQAESADGKADVIDVNGDGGFTAKLFVDAQTHVPLMLSWMDKEPLVIQMGPGGGSVSAGGGGTAITTITRSGGAPGGAPGSAANMTPEEREKLMKDVEAKRKDAEAKLRTVEFRVFYGDYKRVGGVQLPHRIQRSIDGKPTEEMIVESFKVNPKIDAKTFQTGK